MTLSMRMVHFIIGLCLLYLSSIAYSLFLAPRSVTQTFPGSPNPGVSTNTANATVRRDSSGNFAAGLITSTSSKILDSASPSNRYLLLYSANGGAWYDIESTSSIMRIGTVNSGYNLLFKTANTTRAYIDGNTGVFGIGNSSATVSGTGTLHVTGNTARVFDTSRTPASSSEACNVGEQAWDTSYLYLCTASNTWKRIALATF